MESRITRTILGWKITHGGQRIESREYDRHTSQVPSDCVFVEVTILGDQNNPSLPNITHRIMECIEEGLDSHFDSEEPNPQLPQPEINCPPKYTDNLRRLADYKK